MYLIFIIKFILMSVSPLEAAPDRGPDPAGKIVARPLRSLFSHRKHEEAFRKNSASCTDCHDFSVKPVDGGPLAHAVQSGFLSAPKGVCHQCHLGRVSLPAPNQCMLCHENTRSLMPADHHLNWRERHGKFAQLDRDSCRSCHTPETCSRCHSNQDPLRPVVHPGNFRRFHSIEARAKPQSCIECHRSQAFCVDCHSGKISR